jgi:iron(II)-dependent oxidoreductase
VEAHYLDRWPVTNRQFRRFVAGGGYDMQPVWDAQVWPAVKGFTDLTGTLGPRYWRNGDYPKGEDEHPVVGICWHEAVAYARWVGKRLPSEAEWLKAAAWPIALGDGRHRQRRFPWGDTMDHGRCNVWGSGPGRTTSVTQFASGVSAGGVHQLIGNVWEWTSGDFEAVDSQGNVLELPDPMKSIRGGAFDTYFDQQATCQFRSGDQLLARKHNIGFRCALSACDVAPRSACRQREKGAATPDWMRAFKDMGMNMVHLAGFHPQEQAHD